MRHIIHHLAHDGKSRAFVFVSLALTSLFLYLSVTAVQSDVVVYDDGLRNGFDVSGKAKYDLSYQTQTHSGTAALAYLPDQALVLQTSKLIDDFAGLEFWIHGGPKGGQLLALQFLVDNHVVYQTPLGDILPNQWQLKQIPLNLERITGIRFVSSKKQSAVSIDDIRFVRVFSQAPQPETILVYDGHVRNGFILSKPSTDQIVFMHQEPVDVSSYEGILVELQTQNEDALLSLDDGQPLRISSLESTSKDGWRRYIVPFSEDTFTRLTIRTLNSEMKVGKVQIQQELHAPALLVNVQNQQGNLHVDLTNIGTGHLVIQEISLAKDEIFTLDFTSGRCETLQSKESCSFDVHKDTAAPPQEDMLIIYSNDADSPKTLIPLS